MTSSSILLYFKIRIPFFRKNNVIEIVLSCFLIFKIKETEDYVTSPRAWTCDTSMLFHSPLVGLDKETVATSMTYPLINKISGPLINKISGSEFDDSMRSMRSERDFSHLHT